MQGCERRGIRRHRAAEEGIEEPHARSAALLRVELHTDARPAAHDSREAITLVHGPGADARRILRPRHESVGIVCRPEAARIEQRVCGSLDLIPTDLWRPACPDARDVAGEDAESHSRTLLTRVEEQLHPEADAERREPGEDGFADDLA